MNRKSKGKSANLRALGAKVLFAILEQGQSARQCLPAAQSQLDSRDASWLQEMVYGVLRDLPLHQHWLRELLEKPLKPRNKIVEHLLMLGFYQLAFTRVSPHAAVAETVDACAALQQGPMKGLVNAIMRNFIRQDMAQKRPDDPRVLAGLPKWLYRKLAQAYPEQLDELVANMRQRPPMWLRINPLKTNLAEFQGKLTEAGVTSHASPLHPMGLRLDTALDVTKLSGYHQGWFSVQDGAAQLAAELLAPQAGERVLDCCAAPGGKTAHLLELQPELKECVAVDIEQQRMLRVEENLARLDHQATLVTGDAADPQQWWDGNQFDRILLDAPCSATGVIRKHPDIRWLRKGSDIAELQQLQGHILDSIWPLLKPGGTLLYATCSILPEENHLQVEQFLARTEDARLQDIPQATSRGNTGWQILPGEQQMDGFYYARLLKSGD